MPEPQTPTLGPWERRGAALALLGATVVVAAQKVADFDLPWHLATGRWIVHARALPGQDVLAFTQRPVRYAEFVADLLLYGAHWLQGPLGLQLLRAALTAATLLLLGWSLRRYGPAALATLALTFGAMHPWLLARPATFSFVLLALALGLIDRHRRAAQPRTARGALLALVPLQLLWANVHGFAVLGAALALGYWSVAVVARLARGRLAALAPARWGQDLAVTSAACWGAALATCGNMAGYRLLLGPEKAVQDFGRITEWASPDLGFLFVQEPLTGAFLVLALLLLAFGRDAETGRRLPDLFQLGLVAAALVLGAGAVRLLAVAALLLAPVVAPRLAGLLGRRSSAGPAALLLALLMPPLVALQLSAGFGLGFEPAHFPEGAVQWALRARPQGRMWNFLPFGGYLAWRLHPRYAVFVDGRTGWVHDPEDLRQYHRSEHDPAAFAALVQRWGMEWAVCRAAPGERFCEPPARDPEWALTLLDDTCAVYVRRAGPNHALAAAGYRWLRHDTPLQEALRRGLAGGEVADLEHDAALALAQAPGSPRAAFFAACAALGARDVRRLEDSVRRLEALRPGHPATRVLLEAAQRVLGGAGGAP